MYFQIRFNLALAYALVGRVVDAQKLLEEALSDADELQSKSLKTLQDRINVSVVLGAIASLIHSSNLRPL